MTIREEKKDLFTVPQGYHLAHCITGGCSLGVGLAKHFDNVYNMRRKLIHNYGWENVEVDMKGNIEVDLKDFVGEALLIDNVFNLVLKKDITKKPKYKKLRRCLLDMAEQMENLMITKLAIPKLACGHEGLEWERVREIIEEVFEDADVEILVCSL